MELAFAFIKAKPSSFAAAPSSEAEPSSSMAAPSSEAEPSLAKPSSFKAASEDDTSVRSSVAALAADTLAAAPVSSMQVITQSLVGAQSHHLHT